MKRLTASTGISWIGLDAWSETYIGARWLINNVLPEKEYQTSPQHGSIAKMVLISSSHMIELMLSSCLTEQVHFLKLPEDDIKSRLKKLKGMSFNGMLTDWSSVLPELNQIDIQVEPFISVNRLRLRRNSTIHKESPLASLEMARSALNTATIASEAIYNYFYGSKEYKYSKVIKKYPIDNYPLFNEITYIEDWYNKPNN